LVQTILQELKEHEQTQFNFLFTGDDLWMFYAYDHQTMWVTFWNHLDEIERLSHFLEKIIFRILFFFNRTGDQKIAILSKGQKDKKWILYSL
jgi:hypothetical protein